MRGQVDAAYEAIGQFKDLSDQAKLTGQPVDPAEQSRRGAAMIASLEWLRNAQQREAFVRFLQQPEPRIQDVKKKDQPRLWRNADVTPAGDKSALAIVALVSGHGLARLIDEGLLVDDILDREQEDRFHDIRKALRSILVLVDMFPTAQAVVGETREPLAKLVDAFGEVNDASIAYHEAQAAGRDSSELREELSDEYKKAKKLANDLMDNGQLRAYIAKLTPLQLFDVDPFN
jgi:hypothetical protein